MKLLTNILYNTIIFFTSICVVDRVAFYFLQVIASISGFLQSMSYETAPPSFLVQFAIIPLEIAFFVIFTFYFVYMFNIPSQSINYFNKGKWNKLIIGSFIIFVLMMINYSIGSFLKPMFNFLLASHLLPIIWFLLFHIYNLKYVEKVESKYSKFPFYTGIVFVIFLFSSMHPILLRRVFSIFN